MLVCRLSKIHVSSQTHPLTHAHKRTHAYGFGLGHGNTDAAVRQLLL